jgi:ABC-2 type transport system ATP-binding protein
MDEAEHLCDRVAIIDHGHVVACGSPVELTTRVAVAETMFSAAPGLDVVALAASLGLPDEGVRELRAGEYIVDCAATPELVAALTAWLRDKQVLISELRAGRRSLEDVFLRLTTEGRS